MKKVLSVIIVMAILLTSAVGVSASDGYTFEDIYGDGNVFLRNDGGLYFLSLPDQLELLDTNVLMASSNNNYLKDDYKEYFESIDTYVYTENGLAENELYKSENEARKTIPNFIYMFNSNMFLSSDGKVYKFGSFSNSGHYLNCTADTGGVKEIQRYHGTSYVLSEDNTLYCITSYEVKKIASDVKDFKSTNYSVLYRTNNNDLYYNDKFLLADCSRLYFGDGTDGGPVFAKGNNGKWYHKGDNRYFRLEPERKIDGNNITPEKYDTMVEATEYIYRNGLLEWNKDGNVYYCAENTKELIAENVIFMREYTLAVTSNGDMIIFGSDSKNNYYLDMNIKNPEKYAGFKEGFPYINTDNNLSIAKYEKYGRKISASVLTIKLSEKYPDRSDWAEAEISAADEIGYIDSVKQMPMQSNIKREDFCNMIVDFCEKYLGKELSSTSNPFKDTKNEKVIKAYANGIITGVSSDKFAPDDRITREQMCAIMTRATKLLKPDVQFGQGIAFSDMHTVSDWAVEGVNAMSGLGIVKGDGVSITPKSNTSVEQAIAMTYRLYNKIE